MFLVIARDVHRYRPLMLVSVVEKLSLGLPVVNPGTPQIGFPPTFSAQARSTSRLEWLFGLRLVSRDARKALKMTAGADKTVRPQDPIIDGSHRFRFAIRSPQLSSRSALRRRTQ